MALIECTECKGEVSDTAKKCPKCGVQLIKLKRGIFGKLFKWTFIAFNLLMVWWLVSYFGVVAETEAVSDAEKAGAAIGASLGLGMIGVTWVIGDIILGMLVLFTRPK